MTAYVTTAQGRRFELPEALEWKLQLMGSVPCDSFVYRCFWDAGGDEATAQWYRFNAVEEGETVFCGVVDECETRLSAEGAQLEVSGRGMAALLLDNEALGQDYATATLEDILQDHVRPYGIETVVMRALPPVSHFSVASGSSEWAVLHQFCQYYGNLAPKFDRRGQLRIEAPDAEVKHTIDGGVPVTELLCRDRRYGVLSEVWVRDRVRQVVEKVENSAFRNSGGSCRRIMTMPGRSDYRTMRYSGQFQLDQSAGEQLRLFAEVAQVIFVQPGGLVRLNCENWGRNGVYRVAEVQVGCSRRGGWTRLELTRG